MYNILLTDDEQIVIDSLSFIINKNFEGQVNLLTANSGTKALEIATNQDIDIIFMDINMPGLNGLDTVSCILKLKPETVVVILSAFDRFQYAQEAMNLGAFKYITKPVNRNVVIQTIRNAMDYIDNRRGSQNAAVELSKKLDFVSPMVENDFIYACIFNKDEGMALSAYLDYFNLSNKFWCFCTFEFQHINSQNQYEMYLKIRDVLNEEKRCLVSSFMMNRIVVYYPLEDELPEMLFEQEVKSVHTKLSYQITSGIRMGVSSICSDLEKLAEAYKESVKALDKTSSLGGICFYKSSEVSNTLKSEQKESIDDGSEILKQLYIKIKQGSADNVCSLCDLYSSAIFRYEKDLNKIKNKFFEIIVTSRNLVREIDEKFDSSNFDNMFMLLNQENDEKMLQEFLKKNLSEYAVVVENIKNKEENPTISKVCDYINKNLREELSLEQMAEISGVSSFYLSKIFKEEKGVTYITYVTDKRLEMGQKLLKESNLSIKEITSEIGYNDQNYFSRLFKNKFGLSPSDFRR